MAVRLEAEVAPAWGGVRLRQRLRESEVSSSKGEGGVEHLIQSARRGWRRRRGGRVHAWSSSVRKCSVARVELPSPEQYEQQRLLQVVSVPGSEGCCLRCSGCRCSWAEVSGATAAAAAVGVRYIIGAAAAVYCLYCEQPVAPLDN